MTPPSPFSDPLSELIFENASLSPRLVAGCETRPTSPSFPPPRRLVGIELNPGPPKLKLAKAVVVVRSKSTRTPRKRRSNPSPSMGPRGSGVAGNMLKAYTDTLNNPFEHTAIKLGYDCLTETSLAVGYRRDSFTVNADGSFALFGLPSSGPGSVLKNTGGLISTVWSGFADSNFLGIYQSIISARIVSAGIRAFALFPETSASGVLVAGAINEANYTGLQTYSAAALFGLPSSSLGIGTRGAAAVSRPVDNDSFTFENIPVNSVGYAGSPSTLITSTIPYIAGQGFPAGTVIWYEHIVNMEGLNRDIVEAISGGTSAPEPAASDFFASPEQLFSKARAFLMNAAVMDAAGIAADLYSPTMGRALRAGRAAFGVGHGPRALYSAALRQGAENTVMVEEMSSEAGGWSTLVPSKRR